jgi:hypothetical protein
MRSKKHVSKAQASSGAPAKTPPESAPAPAAQANWLPDARSLEQSREELLRRLRTMIGAWRKCPVRSCVRHHRCLSPGFECQKQRPGEKRPPQASAEVMFQLRQDVQRRLAEFEAEPR